MQQQLHLEVFDQSDIQMHIGEIEQKNNVSYAEAQKEALEAAMKHQIMILTGGPGTGKTTVIKGIVYLYAALHGISLDYDDYTEEDYPIVFSSTDGSGFETTTRCDWLGGYDHSPSNWLESRNQT